MSCGMKPSAAIASRYDASPKRLRSGFVDERVGRDPSSWGPNDTVNIQLVDGEA